MKISLITPIYKDEVGLEKLFLNLLKQESKNYELILVIDTNSNNVLDLVDKYKNKFKNKLKLIFNTKRNSRTQALDLGFAKASGEYSIILSSSSKIEDNLIKELTNLIKIKKTDIIEFNAAFEKPIKFAGKIRKAFNTSVNICEKTEIHAFSYPFDFNKIYKTEILKTTTKFTFPTSVNSRYSVEHTIKALLVAKTYSTANKKLITCKTSLSNNFNPLKLIRQWDDIIKTLETTRNDINVDRYIYNQYYHQAIFLSAFVKETKNKILLKKFNEKFTKQIETKFDVLFTNNAYSNILIKEREVLLGERDVKKFHKMYKDIN